MRIDDIIVKQFPLPVEADDLASGPETRINGKDILAAKGRGQEELSQILLIGLLFQCEVLKCNSAKVKTYLFF